MWTNEGDEPHTVTADDGQFDSGTLNPGESFMVTFEGSGTLSYYCEIHPSMVGSITVIPAGEGSTGGAGDTSVPTAPTDGGVMDMGDMASGY